MSLTSRRWRTVRLMAISALTALLAAAPVRAQDTGVVAGTVVDATAQVVPGATVTLTNENTGDVRTLVSNERGEVSFRAVTAGGVMAGFVIGLVEPDHTGHVTTVGVAPEHRRRNLAKRLMKQVEDGFRKRNVRLVRLEVRTLNTPAQKLYESLGYTVTQRLPKYYSNGGDGLLMLKSLDDAKAS